MKHLFPFIVLIFLITSTLTQAQEIEATLGGSTSSQGFSVIDVNEGLILFRVGGDGNVGIGTTSPFHLLHIMGPLNKEAAHFTFSTSGSGVGDYTGIRIGGGSNAQFGTYIRAVKNDVSYWNDDLTFSVTRTNTQSTIDEVMRITSSGKVGIGTTSPDEKLHVAGNFRLNGAFEDKDGDAGTSGQILSSTVTGTDWITAPSGGDFSNGGEAGGTDRTLGNTDNYDLSFKTNNTSRIKIQNDGGVRIDGNVGIYTDPSDVSSVNKSLQLYASGSFSNPYIKVSGHNSAYIDLESRRISTTSGKLWRIISGSGSVADLDRFSIYNAADGYVFNIRAGGDVGIRTKFPTATLDVNGSTGYDQLRMQTSYTPTSSSDANGNTGDIAWDVNYIYIKTGSGWKRATLSTF